MTGVFPTASQPTATPFPPNSLASAFVELIAGQGQGQYLVEIAAYKGGEARSGGGADPTASLPTADIARGGGVTVGLATLRYGDAHWVGAPGDTRMPNIFYEGRVTAPLVIERNLPLLPEEPRRVQRQFGAVEIANGDGALDPILQSYAVDGRRVRVLFGPYMGAYADFGVIADVLATGWEGDELAVRLNLRDQTYGLDLALQTELYGGTGGAEGTEENAGKPKPLLFGRRREIQPVLIDPVNLIYQWHDGESLALDAVWERGLALTPSGTDVADYAALVAQVVAAGEYATCLAASLFKLGDDPAGLITIDARGDADPDYVDTYDQIALRLLLVRAGLSGVFINSGSFAGAAAIGGEMGLYLRGDEVLTAAQAMDRLTAATAAWWGAARDGRVRAGRLTDPAPRSPNLFLDQFDVLALEPEPAPLARWRQRVGWRPIDTVQRGEDISAAVTTERRQFLGQAVRVVPDGAAAGAVKLRHLQASDPPPLVTFYDNESDAQALADQLQTLHGTDRRIFRATVKRLGFAVDLGQFVHLSYPRFGLANGMTFAVIGIREDAERDETILRLWG